MNKAIEEKIKRQVEEVLQLVHDDAVKETHTPELGYSSLATDKLMTLITESNRAYAKEVLEKFYDYYNSSESSALISSAMEEFKSKLERGEI